MTLYGYWRSSSAWRVRIALELKGLSYEYRAVDLVHQGGAQHHPEFAGRNPMNQVPLLEVRNEPGSVVTLTQSVAIIEYLEEQYPEPPLLPAGALARARARELVEIVNSGIQPLQNIGVHTELRRIAPRVEPRTFAKPFIEKGLRALELLALPRARTFLLGETPTLADVYLVPQLYQARRLGVELEAFPTLLRVERSCGKLPAFQRAHADGQPDARPTG